MPPKVLFLHGNGEDYLSDSLLHGLRAVLGEELVDVPRSDAMYDDLPAERRAGLYGQGFTLWGRLPEIALDRSWPIERALAGEFDLIILGDVHRNWGSWVRLRPELGRLRANGTTIAVVDGGDSAVMYPYGPTWWRRMRPWPLPRAHGRVPYFKRELQPMTARVRYYGAVPGRLGLRWLSRSVSPIAFSIPEQHLASGDDPKTKLLATHVVDPEVAELAPGASSDYAFDSEQEYFDDLRSSRFGVTKKKAGWDCMRHYELAASGCVPCFRELDAKPSLTAPHGLDASNCVPYTDARELLERIGSMGDAEYGRLRSGALSWARANTTRARAMELLESLGQSRAAPARST